MPSCFGCVASTLDEAGSQCFCYGTIFVIFGLINVLVPFFSHEIGFAQVSVGLVSLLAGGFVRFCGRAKVWLGLTIFVSAFAAFAWATTCVGGAYDLMHRSYSMNALIFEAITLVLQLLIFANHALLCYFAFQACSGAASGSGPTEADRLYSKA